VCDVFSWYLVVGGAGIYLVFDPIKKAGGVMFIIGILMLLIFGGRKKKGFGKVIGGLGAVYNITEWISNILSYARLLALGLATGVIAQVVNTIGTLAGGGVKGAIVMIVVFLIGHVMNLVINALGAFVHSSRLQYIEFFGKFYIDGGDPFDPFRAKTKYVRLMDDSNNGGNSL
ncbi:MAG: V-type ATPase 116kDa subunit family protein, partial [Eubacteriales bacterium]|nr:V-type ATPase 116kDa subunit family protein [Eubacteriales bacterium]